MSDILGIISRGLTPDILTDHSSALPVGDSTFDPTQLDWSSTLPSSSQTYMAAPLTAKAAPADPLAQWLEQTLGISARFTPPEADPMPEFEDFPDSLITTLLPHDIHVGEQMPHSFDMAQNIAVQDVPEPSLLPVETATEMVEQNVPAIKKHAVQQSAVAPENTATVQTKVATAVTHGGGLATIASPIHPIRVKAGKAELPGVTSTIAPLVNAPMQAVPAPESVPYRDAKPDIQTLMPDPSITADTAVKHPIGAPPVQSIPAPAPLAEPDVQTASFDQPVPHLKTGELAVRQTATAQPVHTELPPVQLNHLPDAMTRPDLPHGLQNTRDIISLTPAPHAPMPHTDPRPVVQQVTVAMVTTRKDATEIALAPEELGRIRLVMSGPDRSHVTIWAERPETLDLVRRNADMLSQHLQEAGIDAKDLDFRQDSGGSWQNSIPDQTDHADHDSEGPATTILVQLTPTPLSDRRVDIRL